jgi:hypothetical protein
MLKCKVRGCCNIAPNPSRRGFCQKHYAQKLANGTLKRLHVWDRRCKVKGCNRKHDAHGYCSLHRQRLERFGDPLRKPQMAAHGEPQRFLEKALKWQSNDCLFWPFKNRNRGYAMIAGDDGVPQRVCRLICKLTYGMPPREKPYALHSCDKGHLGCVNPLHLRWGSQKENVADRFRKKE